MKKLIISFSISILLSACEAPVKFIEPQPQGKNNLQSFPKKLRGNYRSVSDDYTIEISDKLIMRKFKSNIYISKSELDTTKNLQLKGDILFDHDNNLSFKVTVHKDTITGIAIQADTVFILNDENVLRKLKGHYFLNTKLDDGYFVQMISYTSSNKLTISSIKKEELENLKIISAAEEPNDSLLENYQFKLTAKELKNFINEMHGFRSTEVFQKIKLK